MDSIQQHDKQNYYNVYEKCLLLCGQWPYQKPRERLLYMSVILTWILTVFVVQIAQFFVCETLDCTLQTLPSHMVLWIVIVKLLTCYFNNQKIKYLIEQLHADWNILETEEEWEIMRRYAMDGRWYALLYVLYAYIGMSIFASSALLPRILDAMFPLNETRPLVMPCPAYYFVDETKYFYYKYFHLQIGGMVCVSGLVAHDCTFLTYVQHACGLFAVVGFKFEHLLYKRNGTKKFLIDTSDDVYVKNIAFSIQAHQRTLRFVTLVEDTFSSSFAIQFLIIVIAMSCSLIQLSVEMQGDVMELIRYFLYFVGQLFHLVILSLQGQRLTDHSFETHAKIYNGLWYNIPVKSQKLLLFAMTKSTEFIFLSAGKIYILCLENFTLIMKTSVSYFTVMSSFSEP
ncbi:odorant receptor 63a-like [Odontomachus brunneus]|uniref:odorant receptor 63a-like n=1 Tax=Odontomachus brunneus TaxID=486640 RepID=UPI0013F242D4|nr:odorant receptor 63a-like [Odontomachus brunneus]